jgi:predicted ATPase
MSNILKYIALENFKSFEFLGKIPLSESSVIIGPNNSGKTTVLQALSLWNQGIKNWHQEKKHIKVPKSEGVGLNRLLITQVPVKEVKYFWNNVKTKQGKDNIEIKITVGLFFNNEEVACTLILRYYNSEVVYMYPSKETVEIEGLIEYAASLDVKILYPMSGITNQEFLLQKGAIDTYIGQGKTSEILVNLCYKIFETNTSDWQKVVGLMRNLFDIELQNPQFIEANGTLELKYNTGQIKGKTYALDISLSGRGQQEMLLLITYLLANKKSVLLLDEPDAHLELLRQRQVFALLKHLADENENQIIIATHSEVISNEAQNNLTLIVGGDVIDISHNPAGQVRAFIKQYGIEHFYKAKHKKSVIYVEGSTDIDMLLAFAKKLNHASQSILESPFYYFYTQDVEEKDDELEKNLARIAADNYEQKQIHRHHFDIMKNAVVELKGLAIFDSDGKEKNDEIERKQDFSIVYWKRYELENYFVTPSVVFNYIKTNTTNEQILTNFEAIWNQFVLENLFSNRQSAYESYEKLEQSLQEYQFEQLLSNKKASSFLAQYFELLALKTNTTILLRKGNFYKLVNFLETKNIEAEITEKLDLIQKYLS